MDFRQLAWRGATVKIGRSAGGVEECGAAGVSVALSSSTTDGWRPNFGLTGSGPHELPILVSTPIAHFFGR